MSFETVSYQLSDRSGYLALLRHAWGPSSMTGPEFDWWFSRNPAGSLMSLARDGTGVIGAASHSLFRMVLEGEECLVSFSVHAVTSAAARGRGVFRALELKHEREASERGVAAVLAFASPSTTPIFLGPLGWTEIGRLRVWARPLRGLLTPGRQVGLRPGASGPGTFSVGADAARQWPNHVVRDETYLGWRYLDSPKDYRVLDSGDAFAVVGQKLQRGVSAAFVAELVGPVEEARLLLRRAVAEARGCDVLIALPAPEQRRLFLSLGFLPSPMSLHFMGKTLAGRLNPDPETWRMTLGDTDFF